MSRILPNASIKSIPYKALDVDPPLTSAELGRLREVARRLHAELDSLVDALPGHARSASAMARELGIDRSTCQRLISALTAGDAEPEFLVRLPGTRGLQLFIEAVASNQNTSLPAGERDAASTAVDLADRAVRDIAGSQSALARRLQVGEGELSGARGRSISPPPQASNDALAMEVLAGAGEHLTGRWSDAITLTQFYRPVPGDPKAVERATLNGYIGHRTKPDAMPLIVTHRALSFADPHPRSRVDFSDLSGSSRGTLTDAVLSEFSTQPLPIVTARGPKGGMVHTIDPSSSDHDVPPPVDVFLARKSPKPGLHPVYDTPAVEEVWYSIRFPARRMVFDVFLHRSMARQCIASLELHATPPDIAGPQAERWLSRLPRPPRIQMLGDDLRAAETACYTRYVDLLTHMFHRLDWPAEEFVGYRCEVDFPMWNGVYIMSFDFSRHEPPSAGE